jgi:hypothetical protein
MVRHHCPPDCFRRQRAISSGTRRARGKAEGNAESNDPSHGDPRSTLDLIWSLFGSSSSAFFQYSIAFAGSFNW